MDEFFIRPAVEGARLHDPITSDPLAADGETKPRNSYWLKCLTRGDVVEGAPEVPKSRPIEARPSISKLPSPAPEDSR